MGDCPEKYLEFERSEGYEEWDDPTAGVTMLVVDPTMPIPEGIDLGLHLRAGDEDVHAVYGDTSVEVAKAGELLVVRWSDLFKVSVEGDPFPKTVRPPGAEERTVPYRALYADFETFMRDYHGYEETDGKTGEYGYWENPNRKWDWYTPGGRWTGYFTLKPEIEEVMKRADAAHGNIDNLDPADREVLASLLIGSPGLFTAPAEGYKVDGCLKGHIDIERMRGESAESAAEQWDDVTDKLAALEPHAALIRERYPTWTWQGMSEEHRLAYLAVRDGGVDVKPEATSLPTTDEARAILDEEWGEGVADALAAIQADNTLYWKHGLEVEDIIGGREAFIEKRRASSLATFAILMDGMWYARGSMGWFGCVGDDKGRNWQGEFDTLFDDLPDDTPLVVMDCHI